jgi:short-subunit dehydrogenase
MTIVINKSVHERRLQMSGLKGTAVVTGATGGVGTLYAAGLAERGYDLLLVGRQQKALDASPRP